MDKPKFDFKKGRFSSKKDSVIYTERLYWYWAIFNQLLLLRVRPYTDQRPRLDRLMRGEQVDSRHGPVWEWRP